MSDHKRRIKQLEQSNQGKDKPIVIVDWDPDPKPPKPGEIVVTWPEDEK